MLTKIHNWLCKTTYSRYEFLAVISLASAIGKLINKDYPLGFLFILVACLLLLLNNVYLKD